MESVIKWQIGVPKEEGEYLVTLKTLKGVIVEWLEFDKYGWNLTINCKVLAWCPMNEIEPYKE